MAQLRYVDDAGRLQTANLAGEAFVIGRAVTCHLVFDDELTSREHARIERDADGRFHLRDLGSRNKTYVNGQLINETLLTGGEMIRVGGHVVEFVSDTPGGTLATLDFLTPDRTEPAHAEWIKVKAPLSLTVGQLEQLARLSGAPGVTSRPVDIADLALAQLLLDLQAERGFVALRGEAKMELHPLAQRGLLRAPGGSLMPVSQAFIFAAVLQGVAGRYPQTTAQLDAKSGYAVTALVAAITSAGNIVGLVYVDRPEARKPFSAAAMQYMAAAGAQLGTLLADASRRLAQSAGREGTAWLATLRQVQRAFMPALSSSDSFEVASRFRPGALRCGDLGDVVYLDERRCMVVMIDGGGQGVAGLAQGGAMRAAIRAALLADEESLDPAHIFTALSRSIAGTPGRQLVCCTCVGIDLGAGKLGYLNAGGAPPLLMTGPGRLVTLDQPALLLGVDADFAYSTTWVDLPESFRLICHSDGLHETTNAAGEALGDQRVHEALLDPAAFATADTVAERLLQLLGTHLGQAEPNDDVLIVAVGRG